MDVTFHPNPFAGLDSRAALLTPSEAVSMALAEVRSLALPRRPDRGLLATFAERASGPLPKARRTVRLQLLRQVPRSVPGRLLFERATGAEQLSLQSFVIHHPAARILVDPAIPAEVHTRVMPDLEPLMRATIRPPASTIPTAVALQEAGIVPDISLCTHAHWDHVSGLLDLPALPALLRDTEVSWAATGARAPAGGVRRALGGRELFTFSLEGPPVLTFDHSHDLFGDGSVVLVDLAGHTPGSIGILLATDSGPVLLAGDVAWHGMQIEQLRQRSGFPGCLVDTDREANWRALHRLHVLPPSVQVIPSHDHGRATRI
ncbi:MULTISPECIES: MBL fold metallo-hydrolase [Arthrobacter]|uniref:MBL fold metallo-hydrolase n=2 Tax=Arthrobacter TaxID=1663 RepID=A0ABU9KKK9_9MICC|nr:MBL fold metallo-hydrolase [Arthrobacter sp. YJM1]MDP5227433.1 MBL fold metallo-hydrolase [Arthrobacter sp. YJM1]